LNEEENARMVAERVFKSTINNRHSSIVNPLAVAAAKEGLIDD
jgi:hypothetical protein